MTARMVKVLPEPCEQGRKGGERHAICQLQSVEMPHAAGVAGRMVMQGVEGRGYMERGRAARELQHVEMPHAAGVAGRMVMQIEIGGQRIGGCS